MTHRGERDDFVVASSGGNATMLALARCLLDGAGISHVVKNEFVQPLWGWGRMGVGWSFIVGPVEILVSREDLAVAGELLAQLDSVNQRRPPLVLRILATADLVIAGCVMIFTISSSVIRLWW